LRESAPPPGLPADFTILDANPIKTDTANIRDISVVETIKEGEAIYRAGR
jgi:predicted amidohydrolase YtcJ